MKDMRTPLRVAIVAVGLNVVLDVALMFPLKLGGLALATSLSMVLNMGLLALSLRRRLGGLEGRKILATLWRVLLLSGVVGGVTWAVWRWVTAIWAGGMFARLVEVAAPVVCAITVFVLGAALLKIEEISVLWRGREARGDR